MKFFTNKILVSMGLLLFTLQAYGLKTDYDTVKTYHDQEIKQLLSDYTLEDSLNIRIELKRKDVKLQDEKVVNIPGLYQKTGEAQDTGIESVLNLYDRKIVLIKKRAVSQQELDLVESSLKERLYLPEDTTFTMLDDIPKLDDAVQNMKQDFIFGAYSTLIKNGQFLWILIFSIGFIIALWVLAKVWKTKSGDSGATELTLSGSGLEGGLSKSDEDQDKGYNNQSGAGVDSADFETFNFNSLCQNLKEAHAKASGTTAHIMWSHLPDFKSQIQFYEIIKIQNNIPENTFDILDKVFDFQSRSAHSNRQKSNGFNKNTLSSISVELAKLKFSEAHEKEEAVLSALYPNCADHKSSLFKEAASEHYLVLYKIFKDDFMNYMSGLENSELVSKINDLLTFDPDTDHPSDEQYAKFLDFLKTNEFTSSSSSEKTVNHKVVKMLYALGESELSNVKALEESDELKKTIPRLNWVDLSDAAKLKSFVLSLNGLELKAFTENDEAVAESLKTLDERTQFRVKETVNKAGEGKVNWVSFRDKIKRHYSYQDSLKDSKTQGETTHEKDLARAS